MDTDSNIKVGLILLLYLCIALIYGSVNVRMGGSIFGYYSNLFYPLLIIAIIFLISIATLKADYVKLYVACILIITLYLIPFIGIGDYPLDLDSIISTGSIDFILSQRYISISMGDPELFIGATVSYPMLSMLAATLGLISGWADVIVAKNLPLMLSILFIIIYFSLIKTYLGFRVALISLVLLSTFRLMSNVSNTFVNVALANVYIVLGWWIFYRLLSNKLNIKYLLLLTYISATFLLVHHLTLLAYALSIFAIAPTMLAFSTKLRFNEKGKIAMIILFLTVILVSLFSVSLFLNSSILPIITSTFAGKSPMAVVPISHYSTWPLKLLVQRVSYLLFVLASLIVYASLAFQNSSWLAIIKTNHSKFLIPGGFLIFCSALSILIHAPFGYERLVIFGWMLFIPGAVCMILENSSRIKLGQVIIVIILIILIIGNIYQISIEYIDHSDDNEYLGIFKNWVKPQEVDSVLWMIAHDLNDSTIIGDEVVWRLYNMNSPDFNGYWWSGKFSFEHIPEDYNVLRSLKGYLFIRKENFYRVIQSFSSLEYKGEYWIDINEYCDLIESIRSKNIYSNGEVAIFSQYV